MAKEIKYNVEARELLKEGVRVYLMHIAGLLDSLAAGEGAAHAVHADALERRHSLRGVLEDLGNHRVLGDLKHRFPSV